MSSGVSRTVTSLLALWLFSLPAMAAKDDGRTPVAETDHFIFYSDAGLNLHDYLFSLAVTGAGLPAEEQDCVASAPAAERDAWQNAQDYYAANMKERHPRRDPLMRAVRLEVTGQQVPLDVLAELTGLHDILDPARGIYERCFWPQQDARNREKAARMVSLINKYGGEISRRLAAIYRADWPQHVTVDMVQYANRPGANTMSGPDIEGQMMFTSDPDRVAGLPGLEILYHEASHTVFGDGHGFVGEAIDKASAELGFRPPFNLWHAMSFYTSGFVMQQVVDQGADYVPYWKAGGLFARVWPQYLGPIEEYWLPVLKDGADPEAAIRAIVAAVAKAKE